MGRPRLPTQDKIARGNPGKRKLDRQEPDPDYLDDLDPPAWLPDGAKAVWRELADKMRKAKVLTVIDVPAFEKLCVAHARWRAAVRDLEVRGVMVNRAPKDGAKDAAATEPKVESPPQVINQLVFAESMFFKQAVALEREFGMTPAARTRVTIEPQLTLFPDDAAGKPEKPGASKYFTQH